MPEPRTSSAKTPQPEAAARSAFQHFVARALKAGKSAIIETGGLQPALTISAPLLMQRFGRPQRPGVQALMLVPEPSALRGLAGSAVGDSDNIRREASLTQAAPAVLAGTPQRIIDHLRRGNLSLQNASLIAAECAAPAEVPGFAADLAFILSKAAPGRALLLFVNRHVPDRGLDLLKFDRIHPLSAWLDPLPRTNYIPIPAGLAINPLLAELCLAETRRPLCLMCEDRPAAQAALKYLRSRGLDAGMADEGQGGLMVDYPERGPAAPMVKSACMVYTTVPKETEFLGRFFRAGEFIILLSEAETGSITRLEETAPVKFEKQALPAGEEVLKGTIKTLLEKIKTEEDPHELNYYKKLVKSSVPIFLRAYFTGYLVKLLYGAAQPANARKPAGREPGRPMANIFIGVGKNRKVFPRDLSSLLASVPGLQKSDLGDIRVLDNYSFAEVAEPLAQAVIDKLNGMDYRGRKLTVNFARKKDDAPEAPADKGGKSAQ